MKNFINKFTSNKKKDEVKEVASDKEEFISKQVAINKPDIVIYTVLSDFNNFTPMLQDSVKEWRVEGDTCYFKAMGFNAALEMVEKEPNKLIKITGKDMGMEFFFWVQIKDVGGGQSRLRLVVKAKLNAMMKMMVGSKLQKGLDDLADKIAQGFNSI